ncbi:hypothetical protein WDU94_011417 [Cyamophila willieti]
MSVDLKRPFGCDGDFVKPQSKKRRKLREDPRLAQIDTYSDVGVDLDGSFNKADDAESFVGFFGGVTPSKLQEQEDSNESSDEDPMSDGKEDEGDDEMYGDDDIDDNDSVAGLKNDIMLQKHKDLYASRNDISSNPIEIIHKNNNFIVRNNAPYLAYQKLIKHILEKEPEAKGMFLDYKINTEYTINKTVRLKKKILKTKQARDEAVRIGERKLKTKFENGEFKKINGIVGDLYTIVYPPVEKDITPSLGSPTEPDQLQDNFSDHNMELTLENLDGDLEFSNIDDISNLDDTDDEIQDTAQTGVHVETDHPLPTGSMLEATRYIPMELTDLDIPEKIQDDDDLESTASDLEFFVSDEMKELQKEYKIPNEVIRMMYNGEEDKLFEYLEELEQEDRLDKEVTDNDNMGRGEREEAEKVLDDENYEESEDEEDQQEQDQAQNLLEVPKAAVDEQTREDKPEDCHDGEDYSSDDGSDDDDNEEYSEDEGDKENEMVLTGSKENLDYETSSTTTTSSILAQIQNRQNPPLVGVDQPPTPGQQTIGPGGAENKKVTFGCIGIPRDQLHKYKIVWMPVETLVKAYKHIDNKLYMLAHGKTPDGNNQPNLSTLTIHTPDGNTVVV